MFYLMTNNWTTKAISFLHQLSHNGPTILIKKVVGVACPQGKYQGLDNNNVKEVLRE